jgi:hypothetical protein
MSLHYRHGDDKFGSRTLGDPVRETVHSPEALHDEHKMTGPGGLETILLLVRRTPLPSCVHLAGLARRLPPSPLGAELVVATSGLDKGQPIESRRVDSVRAIGENADKLDDPLRQLRERMRTLGPFDVIMAVRFA